MELILFKYTAVAKTGESTNGVTLATSKEELLEQLEFKSLYPTKITKISNTLLKFKTIGNLDIALFFDMLSKMISAGISVNQSLEHVLKEQKNLKLMKILYEIKQKIEEGNNLPDAFKKSNLFTNDVIEMLRVGYEGGKVPQVLLNLKEYYENKERIKSAIIGALTYPVVMFISALLIISVIGPKLIEPMRKFYDGISGAKFPEFSTKVVELVDLINAGLPIILPLMFGLIIISKYFYKTNIKYKSKYDYFIYSLPIIKGFINKLTLYKFIMTLNILYSSGVSVAIGFKMITKSQNSEVMKDEFSRMQSDLVRGQSLSKVIKTSFIMTDLVKNLISTGETTGSLSEQLNTLEKLTKDDFDIYIKNTNAAMKPVATLMIGGILGAIIVAVYLPIISMMDVMKNVG